MECSSFREHSQKLVGRGTDEKLPLLKKILGPCLSNVKKNQAPPPQSSGILGTPRY